MRIGIALLGLSLFVSALALVTAQHRSRTVFIDLERAQQEARGLEVEWNRLRIEQSRLAQPSFVETAARRMGMKQVDGNRAVFLNVPAPNAAVPKPVEAKQ